MAGSDDKIEAGAYRVVQVFCTYFEEAQRQIGGRSRTIQKHRTGRFGEVIDLSQSEAERLVQAGAVRSAGDARELDELYVDELAALGSVNGVEVLNGSGVNGFVLKEDWVRALKAAGIEKEPKIDDATSEEFVITDATDEQLAAWVDGASIKAIVALVGDDAGQRARVLAAEEAREKPRPTLVSQLQPA